MQNSEPKKSFPGSGKFDPINSTYKHEIFLTNGRKLTGYSKSLFYAEMQDKTVLLESIILRLFNNGYFDPKRMQKIEYYRKEFMKPDELIFILTPTDLRMGNNDSIIEDQRLQTFLSNFYKQIHAGNVVTKDIKDPAKHQNVDDIMTVTRRIFKNERELLEFVTKKIAEGIPQGVCMDYFHKYKEKFSFY